MSLYAQLSSGVTLHVSIASHASGARQYFAELDRGGSQPLNRQLLHGDELMFTNIPPGRYLLRIVDSTGNAVAQYPVAADMQQSSVDVRLPEPAETAAPPVGAVPYYRLLHPLDRVTKREMLAASKAIDASDSPSAIEHLEKALDRNSFIPEAHGWRGALYLRANALAQARQELQTAMDQGWKDTALYVNLGLLELLEHHRDAAKAYSRQALSVDPASAAARKLAELLGVH